MTTLTTSSGRVATMTTSSTVSTLARDARKVLGGGVDSMEALEVLRRIDALIAEWRTVPDAPIYVWLRNLRTKIDLG